MGGKPHAFEKSLAGEGKTGGAWLPPVFCPLRQYSAKCSSTSACKLDQGLHVWCIQKTKSSRKVKYLWVWTKGRALTHHIFNQLLAEQEDFKHKTPYKGQDLHLQKCRQKSVLFKNSVSSAFFKIYIERDRGLDSLHPLFIFKHGNGFERDIHHINKDNSLRQHAWSFTLRKAENFQLFCCGVLRFFHASWNDLRSPFPYYFF